VDDVSPWPSLSSPSTLNLPRTEKDSSVAAPIVAPVTAEIGSVERGGCELRERFGDMPRKVEGRMPSPGQKTTTEMELQSDTDGVVGSVAALSEDLGSRVEHNEEGSTGAVPTNDVQHDTTSRHDPKTDGGKEREEAVQSDVEVCRALTEGRHPVPSSHSSPSYCSPSETTMVSRASSSVPVLTNYSSATSVEEERRVVPVITSPTSDDTRAITVVDGDPAHTTHGEPASTELVDTKVFETLRAHPEFGQIFGVLIDVIEAQQRQLRALSDTVEELTAVQQQQGRAMEGMLHSSGISTSKAEM